MVEVIAVGVGGFIGAVGRYCIVKLVSRVWHNDFPLGTFCVNMLGSFFLGLLVAHPYWGSQLLQGGVRLALTVGFMGAFTTFSTLMFESFILVKRNKAWLGVINVLASVLCGLILAWGAMQFLI